jgi:hypothetical protein
MVGSRRWFDVRLRLLTMSESKRILSHAEVRPEPIDDAVARLEAMGAKRIGEHFQGPNRSVQMLDLENNEFCVH